MMTRHMGAAIRGFRAHLGITQTELAERAGMQRAYLSQIESGRIALPNADVRRKIARALNLRHIDLLVAAGELWPEELPGAEPPELTKHQRLLPLIDLTVDNRESFLDELLNLWMRQDRAEGRTNEFVSLTND